MSFFAPSNGIFSSSSAILISSAGISTSSFISARERLILTSESYAAIVESTNSAASNTLIDLTPESIQTFNFRFADERDTVEHIDPIISNTVVLSSDFDTQSLLNVEQQQSINGYEQAKKYNVELLEAKKQLEKEIIDLAQKVANSRTGSESYEHIVAKLNNQMSILDKINKASLAKGQKRVNF
jgi:hypothetical protein